MMGTSRRWWRWSSRRGSMGLIPSVVTAALAVTIAPPARDNPGLVAALTLGVAELMAGSLLSCRWRGRRTSPMTWWRCRLPWGTSPPTLVITTAEVKRLCQISAGDTSQDGDIGALDRVPSRRRGSSPLTRRC